MFLKLFKLTIPETQETYIERAITLVSRVKEGTKDYFDADQTATLDYHRPGLVRHQDAVAAARGRRRFGG